MRHFPDSYLRPSCRADVPVLQSSLSLMDTMIARTYGLLSDSSSNLIELLSPIPMVRSLLVSEAVSSR